MSREIKLLNIYGQYDNHSEARIVGNREGLELILDALLFMLKGNKDGAEVQIGGNDSPLFASDGEGYELQIRMDNGRWGYDAMSGEEPDKNSFWEKQESNPQYIRQELDKENLVFQRRLGIDYFAGELVIGYSNPELLEAGQ